MTVIKQATAERQKNYRIRKKRRNDDEAIAEPREIEMSDSNRSNLESQAYDDICENNELNFSFFPSEDEDSKYFNYHEDFSANSVNDFLYQDSIITLRDFLACLFAIKSKHKLNDKCVDDFLSLFKSALPKPNNCPLNSLKAFKKRFSLDEDDSQVFFLCKNCQTASEAVMSDSDLWSKKLCSSC